MDLSLKGKVVVITGGASGIGRKTCHAYAEEGAILVILVRNQEKAHKMADEISAMGSEAFLVVGDCAQQEACERVVAFTLDRYGRIDIMVHNAAPFTNGSAVMPFLKQTQKIWEENVNVILWGAIHLTRQVLPHMFEKEFGRLIYICSDAGREGDPYQAVYAACKAGLVGFMKSMAHYGGRKNVLANVVSPALTLTDENTNMLNTAYKAGTPEGLKKLTKSYATGRLATAQDLANMIVFLTSERANDVTGQVVGVNGGHFMPSI